MVVKHCAWGDCRSDNRYSFKENMQGVDFVKFPSKHTDVDRCKKWVKACGRANFTLDKVTRDTYICTKHFYSGNGTFKYPDPVPYGITGPEMEHFVFKNKKRRGPLPRTTAGRFIQTETELVSEPKQKQNPTALHDHNMYTSHVKDCGSGDGLKVGVASDTSSVQTSMESEMELLTLETDTLEIEITTDENNTMHDVHNGKYEINILCHFLYICTWICRSDIVLLYNSL